MPCFRCDLRQTDPERGASPWKRAVVSGQQVLVCPGCQQRAGWLDELDRCPACGSVHLSKALGAVVCRGCGAEAPAPRVSVPVAVPVPAARGEAAWSSGGGLADEVAAALDRVLRRPSAAVPPGPLST